MPAQVIFLDGPVGVGKTSLGRAAAQSLGWAFIDGDDHSAEGPWLRSILRISRAIAAACRQALETHPAVIVAYPLRPTDWRFYRARFAQDGVACHCLGLTASAKAIANRARPLSPEEIARSAEMTAQGYGQRSFATLTLSTDEADFQTTCETLIKTLKSLG
jgi:hypothetical protein